LETAVRKYCHPLASSVKEGSFMNAYARDESGNFSRRSGALFFVGSLHVALFYGLLTLSHMPRSATTDPLQNRFVDSPHPRPLPPPLPAPQLSGVKIQAEQPLFDVPRESEPDDAVTADFVRDPSPTYSTSPPPHVMKQVQGGPGSGFPNPDDFYPPLARHLAEQGLATVQVCVDTNGRLTSNPVTLLGTGSARLDEGALKLARAGSGHYRATTEDGRPVNSCYPLRIRFQLKN
jgi:TonB family protein